MKKNIVLFSLLTALLLIPAAFAAVSWTSVERELDLVAKNPSDWSEITNGAHAKVLFTKVTTTGRPDYFSMRVMAYDLMPRTDYKLIYYGDETHNDVWPYATCVLGFRTSLQGYSKSVSRVFDWNSFIGDGVAQKFWIVPASDVDCGAGLMTAWNPNSYLFEHETV